MMRSPLRLPAAVALLVAAASLPLPAQRLVTQPIDSGTRIRLHFRSGGRRTGRLAEPFGPRSTALRYRVPHAAA